MTSDKSAAAAKEYAKQLGDIFKHECELSRKKESCHQLAEFYLAVEKDVHKAKDTFKLACEELGLMESCFALGNLHLTSKELKDPEEALRLFGIACENKQAGACNNAGLIYQSGIEQTHIKKDINKAMEFFGKSCTEGNKNGCFNLSAIYLMGRDGIAKDMKKAFDYSMKGCQMGHPWGCANVSRMYALGDGVAKNPEEAAKYKKLAKEYSVTEVIL
ncbi:cytochrome c oxidase assembly factor 7B [Nematostella vectensis]|uniref:cytochrome c oxidase assembly factor 7B n=1 Tax=Nematostella vectensis TaxID=45351 RepID=UPI0020779BBD|nr:cytochrome c oxidase assembly factor 7B [Nematostella vectensis]